MGLKGNVVTKAAGTVGKKTLSAASSGVSSLASGVANTTKSASSSLMSGLKDTASKSASSRAALAESKFGKIMDTTGKSEDGICYWLFSKDL